MRLFKKNTCNVCRRVFCCVFCRLRHEENDHTIDEFCDICNNGQMSISKMTDEGILQHIADTHLPVHCLRCNKIFYSLPELLSCKCPVTGSQSVITPVRLVVPDTDYESPPIMYSFNKSDNNSCGQTTNIISLTTSTPMHPTEINKNTETPMLGNLENEKKLESGNENCSSISLNKSEKKKRVTFGETSIMDGKEARELSSILKPEKNTADDVSLEYKSSLGNAEENNQADDFCKDSKELSSIDEPTKIVSDNCCVVNEENNAKFKEENDANVEEKNDANIEEENDAKVEKENQETSLLWESALENNEENKKIEQELKSDFIQPTYPHKIYECNDYTSIWQATDSTEENDAHQSSGKTSLWTSMATMMKSVVTGIYHATDSATTNSAVKRSNPEGGYDSTDFPMCKKLKLMNVSGRRPIRSNLRSSCCQCLITKKLTFDKSTQTDDDFFY